MSDRNFIVCQVDCQYLAMQVIAFCAGLASYWQKRAYEQNGRELLQIHQALRGSFEAGCDCLSDSIIFTQILANPCDQAFVDRICCNRRPLQSRKGK